MNTQTIKSTQFPALKSRAIQYPWGATCPVHWPKAYAVVALNAWNQHFSNQLVQHLARYCPNIELMESGELLLDLTAQQRHYNSPVHMLTQMLAQLPNSDEIKVGLAGDALAAFLAVRQDTDKVLRIVPAWDALRVLSSMPLTTLDYLVSGVSSFLAQYGLRTVGEIQSVPSSYLTNRFGEMGKALVLLAQGKAVPRSLWDKQPPVEVSIGQAASKAKSLDIKALLMYRDKLTQQLSKRHYVAGQMMVELHMQEGQVQQWLEDDHLSVDWHTKLEKRGAKLIGGVVCYRLVAREICAERIQGELFADVSPWQDLALQSTTDARAAYR